jgi:3-methyladenine DNA glycosylase AlkD
MTAIQEIQKVLKTKATAEGRAATAKFVPGDTKAYGVRNPVLNELAKEYKGAGFGLVTDLWKGDHIEEKLLAAKLLGKMAKKDPERTLKLILKFSKDVTDWAVCDTLAMQATKPINKSHAAEIFEISNALISSSNPWQRRLAIVLSEWYTRDKKYHPAIGKLLDEVRDDEEYYVKKAVVWIRRNFKKGR